jgi:hypothetical protein
MPRRKAASEEEVAELYSLPLERFTAERNALARRLRGEGERERADTIGKLKKPSGSAWAVNRGVRADPKAAKRLVEAGERLEAAQKAALRREDKPELKQAMAAQQEAVENMLEAVREALGSEQASAATIDRARETLRAVASDEELRAEFATARVAADREAVGFGGAAPEVAPRAPKRRLKARSAVRRREAERELKRVERSLDAADKQVEKRRSRLDKARQALEAAEEELAEAERQRAQREAEAEAARAALSALGRDA